ncbi:hypothetical protein T09_14900 [Trichinella sp. T9]|nr:hypothetical protein T09_14900 [Trichinella sp. T9]
MYAVDLQVQCKVASALTFHIIKDVRKGGAANGRLAYGSPGHAIPDACSILINRSGHVWKCRISAFMLAQSNKAYKASVGYMNSSGKYLWKSDICGSAGTHILQILRADCTI